jgi:hypothetical protein
MLRMLTPKHPKSLNCFALRAPYFDGQSFEMAVKWDARPPEAADEIFAQNGIRNGPHRAKK